jgi:hypothetical protein
MPPLMYINDLLMSEPTAIARYCVTEFCMYCMTPLCGQARRTYAVPAYASEDAWEMAKMDMMMESYGEIRTAAVKAVHVPDDKLVRR